MCIPPVCVGGAGSRSGCKPCKGPLLGHFTVLSGSSVHGWSMCGFVVTEIKGGGRSRRWVTGPRGSVMALCAGLQLPPSWNEDSAVLSFTPCFCKNQMA